MNHQRIYNKIILNARSRQITGYYEKHHIIPLSIGGTDSDENIVKLTAREHYICHLLLIFIHRNNTNNHSKMIHAFMMMCNCEVGGRRRFNSHMYEIMRRQYSLARSREMAGENNPCYGTMWINEIGTTNNKRILKTESIPNGWQPGRRIKKHLKKRKRKTLEQINNQKMARKQKAIDRCQRILKEFNDSGLSVTEFCNLHNQRVGWITDTRICLKRLT